MSACEPAHTMLSASPAEVPRQVWRRSRVWFLAAYVFSFPPATEPPLTSPRHGAGAIPDAGRVARRLRRRRAPAAGDVPHVLHGRPPHWPPAPRRLGRRRRRHRRRPRPPPRPDSSRRGGRRRRRAERVHGGVRGAGAAGGDGWGGGQAGGVPGSGRAGRGHGGRVGEGSAGRVGGAEVRAAATHPSARAGLPARERARVCTAGQTRECAPVHARA